MKSLFYISVIYFSLALLSIGCTKNEPEPRCVTVEVVGKDPCGEGWVILKLLEDGKPANSKGGSYIGQLGSGFVTTDNLPAGYQEVGKQLSLGLKLNGDYSPVCAAVHMMYPAVKINRFCTIEE